MARAVGFLIVVPGEDPACLPVGRDLAARCRILVLYEKRALEKGLVQNSRSLLDFRRVVGLPFIIQQLFSSKTAVIL